jgi:hypothetical protein
MTTAELIQVKFDTSTISAERVTTGRCKELDVSVDLDALRARLHAMTDDKLLTFGKQMRSLVYPLTYDGHGNPSVSAFSIQLDEARAEWRRRRSSA